MFTDEEYESPIVATPTQRLVIWSLTLILVVVIFMHGKAVERIWTLASNKKVARVGMHKKSVKPLALIEDPNSSTKLFPPGSAGSPSCFAGTGDNVMHRRVCKPQPHWSAIDQDACLASGKLHHRAMINVAQLKIKVGYNFYHLVSWSSPNRRQEIKITLLHKTLTQDNYTSAGK